MPLPARLLLLVFLTLLTPAAAQTPEQARQALSDVPEYALQVIAVRNQPSQRIATLAYARLPDKFRALVSYGENQRRTDTIVYDGPVQYYETVQGGPTAGELRTYRARVPLDKTPVNRPFDTFLYLPDTGLFAGHDYKGTFERILEICDFVPSSQSSIGGVPCTVFDGVVSAEKAKNLLRKDRLRGLEDLLPGILDSSSRLRLGLDPQTRLPIAYSVGPDLDRPTLVVTCRPITPSLELPESLFVVSGRLDPRTGKPLEHDISAFLEYSRQAAYERPLGSPEWLQLRCWLAPGRTTPPEFLLSIVLENGSGALARLAQQPEIWHTRDAEGSTPLHRLAHHGNLQGVTQGLRDGAILDEKDYDLRTPLHLAARSRRAGVVQALLAAGADPSAPDIDGNTPLHYAHAPEIASLLLAAGADTRAVNKKGERPLHSPAAPPPPPVPPARQMVSAIRAGDIPSIQRLLEQGFQPEQPIDIGLDLPAPALQLAAATSRATLEPLLKACKSPAQELLQELLANAADTSVVELLVSVGGDLRRPAAGGESLLFTARSARARLALLEAGALPQRAGRNGETVFQHLFLTRGEPKEDAWLRPALQIALEHGEAGELTRPFPNAFATPNGEDALPGATALHLAAEAGELRWVEWLLKLKAPPDLVTREGWTPLHLAAVGGHDAVVERLLQHGASPSTPENSQGWTPLHSATYLGHLSTVKLLLRNGAPLEAVDKSGNSALHLAMEREANPIAQELLSAGASVELRNRAGQTPSDLERQR